MRSSFKCVLIFITLLTPTLSYSLPKELKEVVIESTPLTRDIFELAQPVSQIETEELQTSGQYSLGETLSSQPGITSSSFGQGASRPIIRGQSGDRIRIMQNGIGTQDVSNTSPDHAVGLEAIQSDRIEVVRGPATLLFGPNAMGGVVNVIDNRIPEEMPDKPLSGALDLRGGTVDELKSIGSKLNVPLGQNFALHLDGFLRATNNYQIPNFARSKALRESSPQNYKLPSGEVEARDRRPDSASNGDGGTIGLSYIFEKGFLGASINTFNSDYGLPSSEEGVAIELHQRRFDLRGRLDEPVSFLQKVEFKSGIVDYQHREIGDAEAGTVFKNSGIDSRLEATHVVENNFEGLFGLQYQYSDLTAVGEEAFIKPTQSNSYSGFAFEEYTGLSNLALQAGVRIDGTVVRNIGYIVPGEEIGTTASKSNTAISGAVSAVSKLSDSYATSLSLTHTERAPTGIELFANGPHVGTVAFEVGDPGLDIERSLGVDLNLRKKDGFITGFISAFYNRFNNYISPNPTGEVEDDLPVYEFQAFDADFFGGEAQVTAHLFGGATDNDSGSKAEEVVGKSEIHPHEDKNHLDLVAQVDFVRAYDREGLGNLPRIPPWRLLLAVDYQREAFGLRAEAQEVFHQSNVSSFETNTPSYTLVNLVSTYDLTQIGVPSTVFVRANNLFDEDARNHTSYLKDLAPLPGRNFMAGVRFEF